MSRRVKSSSEPGVTGLSQGDRAMLEPAVYCYHCEYCRSGSHNCCSNIRFLSSPPDPGFFREYVNMPAHNLRPASRGLGWDVGTLFEPLAVVLHALDAGSLGLGETVAVFGTGPIGLLTIATLKASGAGRIWAVEPEPSAAKWPAPSAPMSSSTPAGRRRTTDPEDTGKRGVDLAVDCAAKEEPSAKPSVSCAATRPRRHHRDSCRNAQHRSTSMSFAAKKW